MKNAFILDTETTDKENGEVIEVAYINLDDGTEFSQRYEPSGPISFGAMATHNVIFDDLFGIGLPLSGGFVLPEDCQYMIGHNIEFDYKGIGSPDGVALIDTLPLSRVMWPDTDSHTQMACMYRIDERKAQAMARGAHGALADVRMNKILLDRICEFFGTSDPRILAVLSEKAKIPATIPFGKHVGKTFNELPLDYKQWYLRQSDQDPHVAAAMRGAKPLTLEMATEIINEIDPPSRQPKP